MYAESLCWTFDLAHKELGALFFGVVRRGDSVANRTLVAEDFETVSIKDTNEILVV